MAPLPLLKIVAVLLKEISKPIAASIKRHAVTHPAFRTFTMSLGRSYEAGTQRVEALFAGRRLSGAPTRDINDQHALTVGADLVSNSFLLSLAVTLVVVEYSRAEAKKAEEKRDATERKAARQAVKEARLAALEQSIKAGERWERGRPVGVEGLREEYEALLQTRAALTS